MEKQIEHSDGELVLPRTKLTLETLTLTLKSVLSTRGDGKGRNDTNVSVFEKL